jgi:6-phosphogluconate dehydrogenase
MIGLGRMGGNMVRRLLLGGHDCVVYDRSADAMADVASAGATASKSLEHFVAQLARPRVVWLMVPSAVVDATLKDLMPLLKSDDVVVDGGNSHYVDDIRRAKEFTPLGLHYLDVGVSGGVWGAERGYCLMIGGDGPAVKRLDPVFSTLAPGENAAPVTPGRDQPKSEVQTTAAEGYLHCGPAGSGHFVKMVHNGIEYALMEAYAEGFNLLAHANAGAADRPTDAETAPLAQPEHFQYDLPLPEIAELWRRGSVIGSWLLDLTARALAEEPLE